MNLVIDIGNSKVKMGLFDNDSLIKRIGLSSAALKSTLDDWLKHYPIDASIISSVGNLSKEDLLNKIPHGLNTIYLEQDTPVPFYNLYRSKATLGKDRIALAAAAVYQFPAKDVLIIDAGSCVTYDFKNAAEEYLGGAISPGWHMRLKAMHTFTAKLPRIKNEPITLEIGGNTEESMLVGAYKGLCNEIEGFISSYSTLYPDLTVVLTGGDAKALSVSLKSTIFADSNFLLVGLNTILNYNRLK